MVKSKKNEKNLKMLKQDLDMLQKKEIPFDEAERASVKAEIAELEKELEQARKTSSDTRCQ